MLDGQYWRKLVPPILGLGIVTALFAPAIVASPSQVPFFFPDGWVSLWALDWCFRFLTGQVSLYWSNSIFEPIGASLLLHNLTESVGLPGSLLLLIFPLERAYTILIYLVSSLNFLTAYYLLKKVSNSQLWGAGLGTIYALHPYFLGHLAGGHLNQVVSFPLILLVIALVCLREQSDQPQYLALIAASFFFIVFTDLYLLYFSVCVLILFLLFGFERGHRLKPILSAGLGLLLGAPKLLAVIKLIRAGGYSANHHPLDHSLDLLSFFIPSPVQATSSILAWSNLTVELRPNWAESSAYLGLAGIIIFLVSIGTYSGRSKSNYSHNDRLLLMTVTALSILFLILSIGPQLHFAGSKLWPPMPYYFLAAVLPFFPSVPARFFHPALLMLFVAAAIVVPRQDRSFRLLWIIVAILELCPKPLYLSAAQPSSALAVLAQRSETKRVVDVGLPEQAMYRQTKHRKELVGGFLARRPRPFAKLLRDNEFFAFIDGRFADAKLALAGFLRLGAEAIIVEKTTGPKLDRVQSLTNFESCAEDEHLAIFCLKNGST